MLDRNTVEAFFKEYTDRYDPSDERISLKIEHTFKVAGICNQIAESLGLENEDADMAYLLGMLHDVGRFEQVKRYDTFVDAKSIDHAALGADILFEEGLIESFIPDFDHWEKSRKEILEEAIRYHSGYRVPEGLEEKKQLFADLIRDADKLDILRVNVESSPELIFGSSPEEMKKEEITPEVLQCFEEGHAVLRNLRRTGVDNLVGYISLTFELVFPKSRKIAAHQGYIWKLLSFESENESTKESFIRIRSRIKKLLA